MWNCGEYFLERCPCHQWVTTFARAHVQPRAEHQKTAAARSSALRARLASRQVFLQRSCCLQWYAMPPAQHACTAAQFPTLLDGVPLADMNIWALAAATNHPQPRSSPAESISAPTHFFSKKWKRLWCIRCYLNVEMLHHRFVVPISSKNIFQLQDVAIII